MQREHQMDEEKGIGFALYGNHYAYNHGMLENCHLAKRYYPYWKVFIYACPETTDREVLGMCREEGAHVRWVKARCNYYRMISRLFVSEEVDRFIIRDADSRLCCREARAVQDWVASGRPFHIMHDHRFHMMPIMGGLWGGLSKELPAGFLDKVREYSTLEEDKEVWEDQVLLRGILWESKVGTSPENYLHHRSDGFDSGYSVAFPASRVGNEFVGDTYARPDRESLH